MSIQCTKGELEQRGIAGLITDAQAAEVERLQCEIFELRERTARIFAAMERMRRAKDEAEMRAAEAERRYWTARKEMLAARYGRRGIFGRRRRGR